MDGKQNDSSDKVQRIKENIQSTKHNIEIAEDMIATTTDKKTKRDLQAKNEGRTNAIPSMIRQMKEEVAKKELGEE